MKNILVSFFVLFAFTPITYAQLATNTLTVDGIFYETNQERKQRRLTYLHYDPALEVMAEARLDDMFDHEYFDHVSPDGNDVQKLAEQNNYPYLRIGENLAFGMYEGDKDVINAWMESAGHRENILDRRFTAIGIATEARLFDGEETWIAVQVFARPDSMCVNPDVGLKNKIEIGTSAIRQGEILLNMIAQYIQQNTSVVYPQTLVDAHMALAEKLLTFSADIEKTIDIYNKQVGVYNRCIHV